MRTIPFIICACLTLAHAQISFTEHAIADGYYNPWYVYGIDVDNDTNLDVVSAGRLGHCLSWFENDGNEDFLRHDLPAACYYAMDVNAIDVDVLATICVLDEVVWFENDGSENFTQHDIACGFLRPHMVRTCDLDGDGDLDIAGAAINSNKIAWWENCGGAPLVWAEHTITNTFTGATGIDTKDVDGDGDPDVVAAAQFANSIKWWASDLVGILENEIDFVEPSATGPTIITGDLTLPAQNTYRVYDICGREVKPTRLAPGIYFVACGDRIVRKVVSVK